MTPTLYSEADYNRQVEIAPRAGEAEPYRTGFRRDYARIIHSPAFRRLQRKTQLFPGEESDFFRNRLTHSLEVAQIAKSIAIRLNDQIRREAPEIGQIDLDLIEVAGLAHDLGHPPFGHTGEYALQGKMFGRGGFEGNAQTLRILTRLEKRQTSGANGRFEFIEFANNADLRAGLNMTSRSLAAILKYDNEIPLISESGKLNKGYYSSELGIVNRIKMDVLGSQYNILKDREFKVIEMQIMDLADDIAYSTYDLEDALKAGFASPIDLLHQVNTNNDLVASVVSKLFKTKFAREYAGEFASPEDQHEFDSIREKMVFSIIGLLKAYLEEIDTLFTPEEQRYFINLDPSDRSMKIAAAVALLQKWSEETVRNGYVRSEFTSDVVSRRIRSVDIDINAECPALSRLRIDGDIRFDIDVIKHLTYELHIRSPRLKLIEYRGTQIVGDLFDCFYDDPDGEMLPNDWRSRLRFIKGMKNSAEMRARLVCDYIAGMTDSYALDVYSRLKTTNPSALFRPT